MTHAITDQTNSDLGALISEFDPQGTYSTLAPDVVQAYLLGLPVLAGPDAVHLVPQQYLSQANSTAQALLAGLQHAPAVAQALFVNHSATAYPIETSGIEEYLASNDTIALLDGFISNGLDLVMSDLDVFVQFTSSGLFSGAENLTVTSETGLDTALQSLVTSTVRQDHVYATLVNNLGLGISIP